MSGRSLPTSNNNPYQSSYQPSYRATEEHKQQASTTQGGGQLVPSNASRQLTTTTPTAPFASTALTTANAQRNTDLASLTGRVSELSIEPTPQLQTFTQSFFDFNNLPTEALAAFAKMANDTLTLRLEQELATRIEEVINAIKSGDLQKFTALMREGTIPKEKHPPILEAFGFMIEDCLNKNEMDANAIATLIKQWSFQSPGIPLLSAAMNRVSTMAIAIEHPKAQEVTEMLLLTDNQINSPETVKARTLHICRLAFNLKMDKAWPAIKQLLEAGNSCMFHPPGDNFSPEEREVFINGRDSFLKKLEVSHTDNRFVRFEEIQWRIEQLFRTVDTTIPLTQEESNLLNSAVCFCATGSLHKIRDIVYTSISRRPNSSIKNELLETFQNNRTI